MKAINKNIFREITHSKGRFMSILLICMIGVGFFSGIKATGNDMKISADNFYDEHGLFDLRVLSTFGLTDDDAAAIKEIDGVSEVYTSKYSDLAVHYNDKEYLTRVYSWNDDKVNKILLYEGRLPEAENECLISGNRLQDGFKIGDTVSLVDLTDADEFPLAYEEYTIVGTFDTPMFISMTQKGSTTIGDGALDAFMYISESNFSQEVYSEVYIKSDELTSMQSYSDEYEQLRDEITEKLEELGYSRSNIRYDEVLGEALEKLADGEKELADAKAEGEQELADAKAEIEDAEQQIKDGEKELADAKAEIDDGAVQLADAEKVLADAAKEIEDGEKELADAKQILDDSKVQLDESQAEIDLNKAELADAREQLEAGRAELEKGLAEYEAGYAQYEQGMAAFLAGEEQLKQAALVYGEDNPLIIQQKVELETNRAVLAQTKLQLDAAKAQLDAGMAEIEANEAVLADGEAQLSDAQQQIDEGWAQYNEGLAEYEDGYQVFIEGKQEYLDGAAELEEKRLEYEDGVKQYEEGLAELENAKIKLADGKKEYEEGLETFNTEIADAEKEIADAKQEITDAGDAKWYVFDRDDNSGYSEYASNAERIDQIAMIFPIFFLLVAALVCLTTMSRMVEENRTHVGTLKALGYSNSRIMAHYMSYALIAAVLGSLIGAFGGMLLFPNVIIYAYSIMYIITEVYCVFTADNIIISAGSMIIAIALTVFFSCKKVLAETPAALMRPKAPKAGKRVLLERIGFIWNRMGFFAKVSGRNLFRYKRRMFMTVVGIAGCTALMMAGFGLKDSVSDIIELQYGEIYQYSGYIAVEDDFSADDQQALYDELLQFEQDTVYTPALIKQYTTSFDGTNVQAYVTVAEDSEILEGMIDFHERSTKNKLSLSDGAIVTEKLATLLGASEGDEIGVKINDKETRTIKISGITEHYASHYLYMTEAMYDDLFGSLPEYNMVYFSNGMSDEESVAESFSAKMMECDGVLSVILNSKSSSSFSDMLGMIDMVIIVLIVSAGALAFVVLYNLTNVNITERIREIATLKVLGFYDREVSAYTFRENIILSVMGSGVGLLLGIVLLQFVVQTAEIDEVMFGRNIHATTFIYSFIITVIFSLFVNLIMTRVLKKISMVESLKSVE